MSKATTEAAAPTKAGSNRHDKYLKTIRRNKQILLSTQLGLLVVFLGVWQCAVYMGWLDPFITSSPLAIAKMTWKMIQEGTLIHHVGITLLETIAAFLLGTVGGIIIAAVFWRWEFISNVSDPYIVLLNATPKIALGPVFIIWLGASMSAVIVLAVSITLFIAIIEVYSAFKQVDQQKLMLIRALGGSKWQEFQKVVFPSSIPTIISTLKVNIGLALTGTIVGEFLAANSGLGYLIIYGQNIFNMTLVMTSLVILTIIASVLYYLVILVERRFSYAVS